mmetsp:Transcript_64343/g.161985  ORF Transcript_64343/g.161985 Transcript_64343/m.161985 type:complete len:122 (+) Transcript_64343:475-840(+)
MAGTLTEHRDLPSVSTVVRGGLVQSRGEGCLSRLSLEPLRPPRLCRLSLERVRVGREASFRMRSSGLRRPRSKVLSRGARSSPSFSVDPRAISGLDLEASRASPTTALGQSEMRGLTPQQA